MKYSVFVDLKRGVCYYIKRILLQVKNMSESVDLQNLTNENDLPDDGEYDEKYYHEY